jgi:hypothetical protein
LQQVGDSGRLTDSGILDFGVAARACHHQRAGAEADSQIERLVLIRLQRRKPSKALLDAKRREDRTPAIVFVHDRRAEERDEPVCAPFGNDAAIPAKLLRRHLQQVARQIPRRHGSEPLHHRGGVCDPAIEDGGALPLAFGRDRLVARES